MSAGFNTWTAPSKVERKIVMVCGGPATVAVADDGSVWVLTYPWNYDGPIAAKWSPIEPLPPRDDGPPVPITIDPHAPKEVAK